MRNTAVQAGSRGDCRAQRTMRAVPSGWKVKRTGAQACAEAWPTAPASRPGPTRSAILVAAVCFTGTVERFASTGASPAAGDLGQESEE